MVNHLVNQWIVYGQSMVNQWAIKGTGSNGSFIANEATHGDGIEHGLGCRDIYRKTWDFPKKNTELCSIFQAIHLGKLHH